MQCTVVFLYPKSIAHTGQGIKLPRQGDGHTEKG